VSELTQVTFLAIPKTMTALANSAQRDEDSQQDVINRAIQFYNFIMDEMVKQRTQKIRVGNATATLGDVIV